MIHLKDLNLEDITSAINLVLVNIGVGKSSFAHHEHISADAVARKWYVLLGDSLTPGVHRLLPERVFAAYL